VGENHNSASFRDGTFYSSRKPRNFRYETFYFFKKTDEFDSFVTKFQNLCLAGYQATLTCEAVDGKASMTLRAALGPITPAFHGHGQHPGHQHRGPSYQR
jgi:hypothetical protein